MTNEKTITEKEWNRCIKTLSKEYFCIKKEKMNYYYQEICNLYSNPERQYHNLKHIENSLQEAEVLYRLLTDQYGTPFDTREIKLALIFHDVKENEEESAEYARKVLTDLKLKYTIIRESPIPYIERLILATDHKKAPENIEEAYIKDIDLAILGKSPEEYEEYSENIRKEYAWAPYELYTKERANLLEKILKKESIYSTPYFKKKYQKQAEINIKKEIEKLKSN